MLTLRVQRPTATAQAACDQPDSLLGSFVVALVVTCAAGLVAVYSAIVLMCLTKPCARLRKRSSKACVALCPPVCARCCCCCARSDPLLDY